MDTKGWDFVSICSNTATNKQLKEYMSKNEIKFSYKDKNTELNLTFNPWEITYGGSGKLLRLKTPVKEGFLKLNDSGINIDKKLDGICPVIEMQLDFLNSDLVFNFSVKGTKPGDSTDGAVTIIDVDLNGIIESGSIIHSALKEALPELLIKNKEKISYVFASLNQLSEGWMKPKKVKYSYIDPTSNNKYGFLAILSVINDRDVSNLPLSVDTTMLDSNNDTFLLISEKLFLENIIVPIVPQIFGDKSTSSDFCVEATSNTTGYIRNARSVEAPSLKVGLVWYYPIWQSVAIRVEGDKLKLSGYGKCDITGFADAYVDFSTDGDFSFSYVKSTDNIEFKKHSGLEVDTTMHIPWWAWINVVVGIVTTSVAAAVRDQLGDHLTNKLSSYIGNMARSVQWNNKVVETNDCLLDVGFCIKGSIK